MTDKLQAYHEGTTPIGDTNRLWPLYGAGLENLGQDGQPIEVPAPTWGPDELLIRHDAIGLCFSDTKVIKQGPNHPRIGRDMVKEPVVLGHEVSLTVVGVGENLRDAYKVGDRFIVQAEINVKGFNMAYGYRLQGGLSKFNIVDQRILNGDDGNYLIKVQPATGYAESALTEPWACVTAAYSLKYRTGLKAGGTAWIVGGPTGVRGQGSGNSSYTISAGFDAQSHPPRLLLTQVPAAFEAWLRERSAALGIEVVAAADPATVDVPVDDLILLAPDAELIEATSPKLADFGVCALIADAPLARKVQVDVGRVHYNRWVYVGGTSPMSPAPTPITPSAPRSSRAAARGSLARAGRWAGCMCSARSRSPTPLRSSSAPMSAICAWRTCRNPTARKRLRKGSSSSASTR